MLEQGLPDSVAAEVLGHSTPAVTRAIYQHVSRVLATGALEKVASRSRRTGS
jgi:integrase